MLLHAPQPALRGASVFPLAQRIHWPFHAPRPSTLWGSAKIASRRSDFVSLPAPLLLPYHAAAPPRRPGRALGHGAAQAALGWGWIAAGGAAGLLAGLILAKWSQHYFQKAEFERSNAENARLRAQVEELRQIVSTFDPTAHKRMRLRFTKGINKAVILSLVDEMLENKEVNIWWLPDSLERILYFNVISLVLSVMDEVVESTSMNFAGHNVKLSLTYLDVNDEDSVAGSLSA